MKILEDYNWIDILQQYNNYKKWYEVWLKEPTNESKKLYKAQNPSPSYIKPQLSDYELTLVDHALAEVSPIKEGNTFSPINTLKSIENEQLKALVKYLAKLSSRSELYAGSANKHVRHCALVPLFMAAQKEYNGIKYEQWSKEDKYLRETMSYVLYDELKKWKSIPLADSAIKVARENALKNRQGRRIAPSAWPFHSVEIGGVKASASSLGRHIVLQTWMANVEYRNEYMILDRFNWDTIPKAFDAEVKPTIKIEVVQEEELEW